MKDTDISYLAGIIDGEGTITLIRSSNPLRINPVLYITNTNHDLLGKCSNTIEQITNEPVYKRVTDQRGNTPVYRLQIAKRASIQAILKAIAPYLVAKKQQAYLVNHFYNIKLPKGHWSEEQAELCVQMHKLNKPSFSVVTTTKGHLSEMMV